MSACQRYLVACLVSRKGHSSQGMPNRNGPISPNIRMARFCNRGTSGPHLSTKPCLLPTTYSCHFALEAEKTKTASHMHRRCRSQLPATGTTEGIRRTCGRVRSHISRIDP